MNNLDKSYHAVQDTEVLVEENLKPDLEELQELNAAICASPTIYGWWLKAGNKYGRKQFRSHLLSLMGVINLITFKLAMECGALYPVSEEGEKNEYAVDKGLLRSLIVNCAREKVSFTMPLSGVEKYLKKYWSGSFSSQPYLRKLRVIMGHELGLFSWNEEELVYVERNQYSQDDKAPPCVISCIDFEKLLIVQQQLELMLGEMGDQGEGEQLSVLTLLPDHYGNWTRMLYNAWFEETEYNRIPQECRVPQGHFLRRVERYPNPEVVRDIQDMEVSTGLTPERGEQNGDSPCEYLENSSRL